MISPSHINKTDGNISHPFYIWIKVFITFAASGEYITSRASGIYHKWRQYAAIYIT